MRLTFFLLRSVFRKWKNICLRHVEDLSLMESHLDIKRAGRSCLRNVVAILHCYFQKTCGECSTNGWVQLALGDISAFYCGRNRPNLIGSPFKLPGIDGGKST